MTEWLVAVTRPNFERKASQHLSQQGFEFYLPKILNKKTQREILLFPRYIFILAQDAWHKIFYTRGISRVLLSDEKPAMLPEKEIQRIRGLEKNGFVQWPNQFRAGQKVRIIDGCMQGLVGLYQGMSRKDRESVLLSSLGLIDIRVGNLAAI